VRRLQETVMENLAQTNTLTASDLFSDSTGSTSMLELGQPRYSRRITDKVLAAFNHAYVLEEIELAQKLWEALVLAEEASLRQHSRRRPNQSIELAEKWVGLVDARQKHQKIAKDPAQSATPEADEAYADMRMAYRAWMEQFDEA
jgi:hypothetical protein